MTIPVTIEAEFRTAEQAEAFKRAVEDLAIQHEATFYETVEDES